MEQFNFDEIKDVLDIVPLTKLSFNYLNRHEISRNENDKIINDLINYMNWNPQIFRDINHGSGKLRKLVVEVLNKKNQTLIEKLYIKLKELGYNSKSELILIIRVLDVYMSNKISWEDTLEYLSGMLYGKVIRNDKNSFLITSDYGNTQITQISSDYNLEVAPFGERKNSCHYETTIALSKHSNMYGGYFDIPREFKGFFDHSVVIDEEKNIVYDFANNISISLSYFQKIYPNLSFIIKGSDFISLNEKVKDYYGEKLYMYHLEEIRRTRTNGTI